MPIAACGSSSAHEPHKYAVHMGNGRTVAGDCPGLSAIDRTPNQPTDKSGRAKPKHRK